MIQHQQLVPELEPLIWEATVRDFKAFLLRGNLVDMATGIAIGLGVRGAVVTAFVGDLVDAAHRRAPGQARLRRARFHDQRV